MTVLCGGGTSSAKEGVAPTIFMSSSAAGALLNNVPTVWAVPLAAFVGLLTYNASQFCSQDPPPDPGITALDVAALITGPLNPASHQASLKVAQLISRYAWFQFCKCDTVATPAPPAPPPAPAGLPQLDPTYLPPHTATACTDITASKSGTDNPASTYFLIGNQSASINDSTAARIAPGATTLRWTATSLTRPPSGFNYQVSFNLYDSAGTSLLLFRQHFFVPTDPNPPITFTETISIPAGVAWIRATWSATGGGSQLNTITTRFEFFCGTTPDAPQLQCCPPDPTLTAKVDQILQYVTLLQRQIDAYAYVPGSVHNVSGNGQIAVTDRLLGLKIEATTIPTRVGRIIGNPDHLWDVGEVSIGDADGWFYTRRIDRATIVWTPKDCQLATLIGYSIPPDASVRITELKPEP